MSNATSRCRPQTIRQAKAAYKKSGGSVRLTEAEKRRLERQIELDRRAERIQYRENQKKIQQKRRTEQEQQERESLLESGIGLATQLVGFDHTQAQMKKGMEAFLGISKTKGTIRCNKEEESIEPRPLEAISSRNVSTAIENRHANHGSVSSTGQTLSSNNLMSKKQDPWDTDDLDDLNDLSIFSYFDHQQNTEADKSPKKKGREDKTLKAKSDSFTFGSDIDDLLTTVCHTSSGSYPNPSNILLLPNETETTVTGNSPSNNVNIHEDFVVSDSQILRELT